jgi:hypothetical protein
MLAVSHCMVPASVAGEFTTHAQAALAAFAAFAACPGCVRGRLGRAVDARALQLHPPTA